VIVIAAEDALQMATAENVCTWPICTQKYMMLKIAHLAIKVVSLVKDQPKLIVLLVKMDSSYPMGNVLLVTNHV
jgi:hypothetical protein